MSAALRRLAKDLKEAPDDPQREQALLAMFDQGRHRSRVHPPVWTWLAAAGMAFAAVLTWHLAGPPGAHRIGTPPITSVTPPTGQARANHPASPVAPAEPRIPTPLRSSKALHADLRSNEALDSTEFVAWPGATAWPPFESGELIRIDIPTEVGVVQAEVLVGQDGFARAIRLVR